MKANPSILDLTLTMQILPSQCQFSDSPCLLWILHDYCCLDVSSPQVQTQLNWELASYPSSPSWRRWWWWRRGLRQRWSSFVARYSRVIPYCSNTAYHSLCSPFRNPENYVSLVTAQVLEWFGDVKHFNSAAATAVAPLAARALLLPFAAFKKSFLNVGTFGNDTLFF